MAMDSNDIPALASLPILERQRLFERKRQMRSPSALLTPALAIALSVPLSAGTADSCKQDLSPASKVLSDTREALIVFRKKVGEDKCEAFRRRPFLVVTARDVLPVCKSGTDRIELLSRFDQIIEDVNTGIAETCQ